jgi:hypothetical protein
LRQTDTTLVEEFGCTTKQLARPSILRWGRPNGGRVAGARLNPERCTGNVSINSDQQSFPSILGVLPDAIERLNQRSLLVLWRAIK